MSLHVAMTGMTWTTVWGGQVWAGVGERMIPSRIIKRAVDCSQSRAPIVVGSKMILRVILTVLLFGTSICNYGPHATSCHGSILPSHHITTPEFEAIRCGSLDFVSLEATKKLTGHSSAASLPTGPVMAEPFISPFGLTICGSPY